MQRGWIFPSELVASALLLTWSSQAGPPGGFDRLSDSDRLAFQERFVQEIWPLLERNGKNGCVGCHSGKIVSDLRLKGQPNKDFAYLLKEGYLQPKDPGSLLSRVTDPDNQRRMPPKKLPAWKEQDVEILRAFVNDLDKKQKK